MKVVQKITDKGLEHRQRRRFAQQNDGAPRRVSAQDPVFAKQKWPLT